MAVTAYTLTLTLTADLTFTGVSPVTHHITGAAAAQRRTPPTADADDDTDANLLPPVCTRQVERSDESALL